MSSSPASASSRSLLLNLPEGCCFSRVSAGSARRLGVSILDGSVSVASSTRRDPRSVRAEREKFAEKPAPASPPAPLPNKQASRKVSRSCQEGAWLRDSPGGKEEAEEEKKKRLCPPIFRPDRLPFAESTFPQSSPSSEAPGAARAGLRMASTATCTRFTDEYQLFEELGK